MCGIVGYVGTKQAAPLLLDGLRRLEYRGYDSAGLAILDGGELSVRRAEGKLQELVDRVAQTPVVGSCGLGHTRWATHGRPSERNAHPIRDASGRVVIIHNGIIENFLPLKRRLEGDGVSFVTDTDTEVIANLVASFLDQTAGDLAQAVRRARRELEGHYAFAALARDARVLVAARSGPPLVLGVGDGEHFLASDPIALLASTRDIIFLENGDQARLDDTSLRVLDQHDRPIERPLQRLTWDPIQAEKGGYKHFMLKEIHEQPRAIQDTFGGRLDFSKREVTLDGFEAVAKPLREAQRLVLLACGTSWHAALVGKFMIESLAGLPVEVDYGSEYRYRNPIVRPNTVAVGITQSGETADTLSAMEAAKERGATLLTICNVPGSQATRITDGALLTHAGPEIGVASTKAFTTQLVALYLLALELRGRQGLPLADEHLGALAHLPSAVEEVLGLEAEIDEVARQFHRAEDFLYLGRGANYPIALEGALKLKEISYIHAEGYPAGEMKHGPIALIDEDLPVVAIATDDMVFDKVRSNLQEVRARDGRVLVVTDRPPSEFADLAEVVFPVPRLSRHLQPIVNVVPLQLLAYSIGVKRGCDVDQPRNLAKSVTVE
jgi:glucosamine--fructose-6-phosphate aminotransferase (isomerizing)